MTAKDFKEECNSKLTSDIFDKDWNPDYQESISLTIQEMRDIYRALKLVEVIEDAREFEKKLATQKK